MITIQIQYLALKIVLNVTKNTDKTKIDYNCNRKQYLDFINHKRKYPLHGNSITAFKTIYQEIMLRGQYRTGLTFQIAKQIPNSIPCPRNTS